MPEINALSFHLGRESLRAQLLTKGEVVDVGEWQSIRGDIPQSRTIELQDVHFRYPIPRTVEGLQREVSANLPWAEDHFHERVSGEPLNPGVQYKNWPWYRGNVEKHQTVDEVKFSHTYMERFWPKQAGDAFVGDRDMAAETKVNVGLRYKYGDLQDVVSLLSRSPYTRQAYLPVWFPEDTGAVHGERVPCTLGYHFLLRNGRLNVYYFIRSCDFFRHFADDVYLAARLCQWIITQLEADDNETIYSQKQLLWDDVKPGNLIMQISSLHVFEAERKRLDVRT